MYTLIGAAAGFVFPLLILGVLFLVWPRRGKPGINTETVFCPECAEKMPKAADVLSRAYSYRAGEPITGFGSTGGCNVVIQYPYVFSKPVFTYSDMACASLPEWPTKS